MWLSANADLTPVHPPESSLHLVPLVSPTLEAPVGCAAARWRHSGWKSNRDRIYRSLLRTAQPRSRIDAFETCGDRVYVLMHKTEQGRFMLAGSGCHDRFCLPCANARSREIASRITARIEGVESRFITLTLKTAGEPLAESLDRLYTSFAKLRRSRLWQTRVSGGVALLEVKWIQDTKRWHPHLHILTQGLYIPLKLLREAWLQATGDSHIVDIQFVRNAHHCARYVAKYASKPFNDSFLHDTNRLDEAVLAMKGRRLALTFGQWRGYRLTVPPSDREWQVLGTLAEVIFAARDGHSLHQAAIAAIDPQDLDDLWPLPRAPAATPHAAPAQSARLSTLFPLSWHA